MKYHIEKNTIQETLVIPLYARALCTRVFPICFPIRCLWNCWSSWTTTSPPWSGRPAV